LSRLLLWNFVIQLFVFNYVFLCIGITSHLFNEIYLFYLFVVLKSRDIFWKVITNIFIIVHDWINVMVKIVEPPGVLYKTLKGNHHPL
jgi:hypothetical protein